MTFTPVISTWIGNPRRLARLAGAILFFGTAGVSWAASGLSDTWQAAVRAYLSRQYPESAALLEKYVRLEQDPERLEAARFFLAENYRLQNLGPQALRLYEDLARSAAAGTIKVSARFRAAELAYNRGDYARTRSLLGGLARESQADFLFPQIRMALVKADLKLDKVQDAQKVFNDLLDAFPRALLDPEIKFLFAIMKEYQGQTIDALKIYEELGDNPLASLFSGAILESEGRFLPAIEAYNQVIGRAVLASHREMAWYFKARAFYKSGDLLSAGSLCRDFLGRFPRSACRGQVALLHLLVLVSQARFVETLQQQAALAPDLKDLGEEDQALVFTVQGEAALNLNRFDLAASSYAQAAARTKKHKQDVLLKLAFVQMVQSQGEAAYRSLNDYFRLASNPAPLAHLLFTRICLQTGRDSAAFRAVQTLAERGEPMAELAFYYLAAGDLDRGRPETLTTHSLLLEKYLSGRAPAPEYREAAAWSRMLVADAYYRTRDYARAREYYQKAQTLFPYGSVVRRVDEGLTWCAFALQDYADVLARSERLASGRIAPKLLLLRAHAHFNLQHYPEAVQAYSSWLKDNPGQDEIPNVYFQIGWAYYLHKDYLDAVQTWQELARLYPTAPDTPQAMFWTADTYFQAGENGQARAVYERLLALVPDSPDRATYQLRIAQTYFNERQDAEAIKCFADLLQSAPDSEQAREARSGIEAASYRIADRLNDLQAFRDFISRFPDSTLSEDIQYRIGEAYFQKERYPESLEEFLHFVLAYTKSPRTPNAQYYIAVCQEQIGNTLEAALQDEAFLKTYPQHELAPEMTFRLASNEFQLERYAEAAEHFAACAEKYSLAEYQPRAWYNAAVCYERLQLPEQAVTYYGKLAAGYPKDANTPMALSRLVVLQATRQDAEGVDAALRLLAQNPDRELQQKTWLGLAAIYQEQGDEARREDILKTVMHSGIAASDDYSLALIDLASLYEQRKDWSQALAVYQRLAKTTAQPKWRDAARKRVKLLVRILSSAKAR